MSQRSVLVTGGTGALGRAVVAAFLDGGDRVVVPWIVREEVDAILAAHANEVDTGQLSLVEADMAMEAGAAAAVRAAENLEVVVNGVGGFGGGAPIDETDLALFDDLYRINVRTAAAVSRAAIPLLRARGRGCLVFVASQAALDCPAGIAAYSASKAAVAALARSVQNEVADAGLRSNAIFPTTIDTPANRAAMPDADFSAWTAPERIADVVRFLASDAGATVRGAQLPV